MAPYNDRAGGLLFVFLDFSCFNSLRIGSMASRRVLGKAFERRHFFCKAQSALNGNWSAQFAETIEFQRFDPWFLQRRAVVIPAQSYACRSLIYGGHWWEDLKILNKPAKQSPRLDVVHFPERKISPEEGRRLHRLAQESFLLKRLRQIPHSSISRKELLQVARVMENILPLLNDSCRVELKEMEKQKAEIDAEVSKIVRRELWCALGFMSLQTAYLLWLTFWELSWDVMEPICFFLTSIYFLAGYAFFLMTSVDPTFQGFSEARFEATQKRLMKKRSFDMERLKELRLIASPPVRQSACGRFIQEI